MSIISINFQIKNLHHNFQFLLTSVIKIKAKILTLFLSRVYLSQQNSLSAELITRIDGGSLKFALL
jgi:hypothetical protein